MNCGRGNDEDPSLRAYFNDIAKAKPLSRAREEELAVRIQKGDAAARDELVQANLLFVVSVAKKYQNRGLSLTELISAGNMGLMTAADRFDPARGYKFISYAVWWIRQSILQALAHDVRTVHLPLNRVNLLHKIARAAQQLGREHGEEPDVEEIAAVLDVSVEEIRETLLKARKAHSLDRTFAEDGERSLMDMLVDTSQAAPDMEVLHNSIQTQLETVLRSLDERELRIIHLYFGLDGNEALTLEQIGKQMNLTRERIRQVKERALGKLRHPSCYRTLKEVEKEL